MSREHRLTVLAIARALIPLPWIALPLIVLSCGEPETPRGPPPPTPEAEPARVAPPSEAPLPPAPVAPAADLPPAPATGCAMGEPVRVHAGGWASVAALGDGFVVAGSAREDAEIVFLVRADASGSTTTIARGSLEHPVPADHRRAVPAVASVDGARVALAIVDGQRRLVVAEADAGATDAELAFAVAGTNASLRFTPALERFAHAWALAWTEERDESMRVRAGLFSNGALGSARELRSDAGGSAAPTFVRGGPAPALVFLDPRAGVSVAHRAGLGSSGYGDPAIARPINLVTEPPELTAVRIGARDWIAYTAVGSAATTAVGLSPLEGTDAPVALVPGTGYGVLHVDAAPLGERAVFVADAPQDSAPGSPRELHVRVVGADGQPGAPAIVRGPDGGASRGRIASARDGLIAVTFTEGDAVYLSIGRCAPR